MGKNGGLGVVYLRDVAGGRVSVAEVRGAGRILENLKSSPMCYSIERRDHCVAVFRVVHCSLAEIQQVSRVSIQLTLSAFAKICRIN